MFQSDVVLLRAGAMVAIAFLWTACTDATPAEATATPAPNASSSPIPYVPPPTTADDTGIILVSDGGNVRVSLIRTDTGVIFYDLDLPELIEDCRLVESGCILTEIEHTVHEDRDYLDLNLALGSSAQALVKPASVKRLRLSEPVAPVFSLERLDWSGLSRGTEICDYDPADPCNTGSAATCALWFPHDVEILADDPTAQTITYLIADLATQRVLEVHFDYSDGNTCGKVAWVLDSSHPDYDASNLVNDADLFHREEGDYLLTSYYSSGPVLGSSKLDMWYRETEDSGWSLLWTFPTPEKDTLANLNTPHAPLIHADDGGGLILRYAHSRGDSDQWGAGYRGTLGAATLVDLASPPIYRFDSKFPEGYALSPMGFVRDIEQAGEGRYLVTDSGCVVPGICPLEGRVYLIDGERDESTSPLSGAWTEDHSQQHFVSIDMETIQAFSCGISTTYEADYTTVGALGQDLRARLDGFERYCLVE